MAFKHYATPLTLTGAAQRLTALFADPAGAAEDIGFRTLFLQPDGANGNPIYVGSDSTVSATSYGFRLEKGTGGVPPVPQDIGHWDSAGVKLSNIWVFGTAGEKLHVCGVPA